MTPFKIINENPGARSASLYSRRDRSGTCGPEFDLSPLFGPHWRVRQVQTHSAICGEASLCSHVSVACVVVTHLLPGDWRWGITLLCAGSWGLGFWGGRLTSHVSRYWVFEKTKPAWGRGNGCSRCCNAGRRIGRICLCYAVPSCIWFSGWDLLDFCGTIEVDFSRCAAQLGGLLPLLSIRDTYSLAWVLASCSFNNSVRLMGRGWRGGFVQLAGGEGEIISAST